MTKWFSKSALISSNNTKVSTGGLEIIPYYCETAIKITILVGSTASL